MSVGHPRGTHSRYVIGCCLIPLGIYGGIGCVWRMPSGPLYPLLVCGNCLDHGKRIPEKLQFYPADITIYVSFKHVLSICN